MKARIVVTTYINDQEPWSHERDRVRGLSAIRRAVGDAVYEESERLRRGHADLYYIVYTPEFMVVKGHGNGFDKAVVVEAVVG